MSERVEYGPAGFWHNALALLFGLAHLGGAVVAWRYHNEGAILLLALFGGIYLGFAGCGCRVTKRERLP